VKKGREDKQQREYSSAFHAPELTRRCLSGLEPN
jgi:hypothetical protein